MFRASPTSPAGCAIYEILHIWHIQSPRSRGIIWMVAKIAARVERFWDLFEHIKS